MIHRFFDFSNSFYSSNGFSADKTLSVCCPVSCLFIMYRCGIRLSFKTRYIKFFHWAKSQIIILFYHL